MIARYPVGTKVKLNTGEVGVVVSQTEDTTHPIIAVLEKNGGLSNIYYNLKKNKNVSVLEIRD